MGIATKFLMIKKEVFEKELFQQFPNANKELIDAVLSYAQSTLDEKLKKVVEDICSIIIIQFKLFKEFMCSSIASKKFNIIF